MNKIGIGIITSLVILGITTLTQNKDIFSSSPLFNSENPIEETETFEEEEPESKKKGQLVVKQGNNQTAEEEQIEELDFEKILHNLSIEKPVFSENEIELIKSDLLRNPFHSSEISLIKAEIKDLKKQEEEEASDIDNETSNDEEDETHGTDDEETVDESTEENIVSLSDIQEIVTEISTDYNNSPSIVLAIIEVKSNFNASAKVLNKNGHYDHGLMQINEVTAEIIRERLDQEYVEGLEYDIRRNIEWGNYYLDHIRTVENTEDMHFILTAYNNGIVGAKRYYEEHGTYESLFSHEVLLLAEGY